ncbi:pyridoxamine 5'-phosphate oxidase family protein [Acidobacteriota bacterium]
MKISARRFFYFALILFVVIPITLTSGSIQQKEKDLSKENILDTVKTVIKASKYSFLITLDESGQPQARVMEPFEPEQDMTIWFGTHKQTRKVKQIQKNSRATVTYSDNKGMDYVTLLGEVRLVDDPKLKKKIWNKSWKMFYPGGAEDENYILIEFIPHRIEVMSITRNVLRTFFKPEILVRQNSDWIRGE